MGAAVESSLLFVEQATARKERKTLSGQRKGREFNMCEATVPEAHRKSNALRTERPVDPAFGRAGVDAGHGGGSRPTGVSSSDDAAAWWRRATLKDESIQRAENRSSSVETAAALNMSLAPGSRFRSAFDTSPQASGSFTSEVSNSVSRIIQYV